MILATVGVVLALASQRGGAGEAKPSAPAVSLEGRARQVTAGYLRMTDPGFVARALEGAESSAGRALARSVLTPETIANRGALMGAYAPYLRGVERVSPAPIRIGGPGGTGNGGRPKPVGPNAPKAPPPAPSGEKITIVYGDKTDTLDLGSAVVDEKGTGFATATYHGVAPADGKLSVSETYGTAIDAIRMTTYSGVVVDGKPQGTSTGIGSLAGKTLPVKKGQEFAVRVRLAVTKAGTFSEPIVVHDGTRKITLAAKGTVAPKAGELSCWIEEGDVYVLAGGSVEGKLHVRLNGNAPSAILVDGQANLPGTSAQEVRLDVTGAKLKANEETTIPFRISAVPTAPNATGTLLLRASAYDGKARASAQTTVKVETVWTELKDFTAVAGNVSATGTFRYATSGFWDFTLYAKTTSKNVNDYLICLLMIDTPTPTGERLAVRLNGELAAKNNPGPSARTFSASGQDARLMGTAYVNASIKGTFMVDPSGEGSSLAAPYEYWVKSNKASWLQ